MKKSILVASALAVMLTSGVALAQADSKKGTTTGTIELNGSVTTASCDLGTVAPVNLGSVSTRTLSAAQKSGQWGKTTIEFNNCDITAVEDPNDTDKTMAATQGVVLSILGGQAAEGNDKLWANKLGDAANVGIELMVDGKVITPAGQENIAAAVSTAGTASYGVSGRMVATGAATEGDVSTSISFVAGYK